MSELTGKGGSQLDGVQKIQENREAYHGECVPPRGRSSRDRACPRRRLNVLVEGVEK